MVDADPEYAWTIRVKPGNAGGRGMPAAPWQMSAARAALGLNFPIIHLAT